MQFLIKIFILISTILISACQNNKLERSKQLIHFAEVCKETDQIDSAVFYYKKAANMLKGSKKNEQISKIYNQLGELYLDQSLELNAYEIFNLALKCNNNFPDQTQASRSLRGIGKSYAYRFIPDSALQYHLQAQRRIPRIKDHKEIAYIYNNLSNVYLSLNKKDSAYIYIKKALSMLKDSSDMYYCYSVLGNIFTKSRQYDSAYTYLRLGCNSDNIFTKTSCYIQLTKLAQETKNPDSGYYQKISEALYDSIEDGNQSARISYMDQKSIQNMTSKAQYLWSISLIGISILSLFIISYLLYIHKLKIRKSDFLILENEAIIGELHAQLLSLKEKQDQEQNKTEEKQAEIIAQLKETEEKIQNQIKHIGEACKKKFMKHPIHASFRKEISNPDNLHSERQEKYRTIILKEFTPYLNYLSLFIDLSQDDQYLCCLLLLDLNAKECSLFRNITHDGIRTQKRRIRNKMDQLFITKIAFEYL